MGNRNHYGETIQNPVDIPLGINNVLDELPTELAKTHLANILWGVRYPIDTPYGIAGRFAYLRLGFEFGQ